jgi:hypothetical protein
MTFLRQKLLILSKTLLFRRQVYNVHVHWYSLWIFSTEKLRGEKRKKPEGKGRGGEG